MQVVLATENAHKLLEIRAILTPLIPDLVLIALTDIASGLSLPEETGDTFEANALLKAAHVARETGLPCIGDDSGLCVDALDGAPGIHSRRWAGPTATDSDRIAKLLRQLTEHSAVLPEQRGARFVSAAVLATPEGASHMALGECDGIILHECRGANGFGYDPVFFLPERNKTMAELTDTEKNTISHRAHSFRQIAAYLIADT